ncbi:hypothetical protein BCR32DRAFT_292711 [Anaeromyces robustus]|uniref:Uncharacterized protein n=1 Tax=Anaeromyces robustus TaxID=1754192 RepID=A0A1Y1X9B2_9FUNG|nr:hypothetical protein BCR32DRAFT_292711 [Anaeromyces robustus]|eukprot:ORX82319.1 hypothetical protein BCR32DRAFT_292711 [Anaeromyces robustus]
MNIIKKIKNDKILLALVIIFILEVVTCILRYKKYVSWYFYDICVYLHYWDDYHCLYPPYENKITKESCNALAGISREFPRYSDSSNIPFFIDQTLAQGIMVISILNFLIAIICLLYDKKSCNMCCYMFSSIFCIIGNSIYLQQDRSLTPTIIPLVSNFSKANLDKYTLNMTYTANKTIEDGLDYYYYGRKTWLKFLAIAILLECIIQMVLIKKYYSNNKPTIIKQFNKHSDDYTIDV